ncbi:MAG: PEGA domain-containing protein [Acidobacteriota bacterium]
MKLGPSVPALTAPDSASSLEAFGSEDASASATTVVKTARPFPVARVTGRQLWLLLAVVAAVALVAGGTAYWKLKVAPARAAAATGSLTIESDPSGLAVVAGGVEKGRTPLTLALAPGTHQFELVRDGADRQPLTVVMQRGATVVHHVKFEASAPASATGSLIVTTDPAKLRVTVDGVAQGVSPVTIEALPAGSHKVDVHSATGVLTRSVDIVAGQAASVIVTAAAAAPTQGAGWLAVASPVPVQLFEGSDLIGTSESPRLMLPSGRHSITLVNKPLGYSEAKVVQVPVNGSATLKVDLPRAPVNLNALPWAQAWIDGVAVGETPIGKHLVTIGSHEVVFRHPDLGERRQTVVVTLASPARVSVDMRKP